MHIGEDHQIQALWTLFNTIYKHAISYVYACLSDAFVQIASIGLYNPELKYVPTLLIPIKFKIC